MNLLVYLVPFSGEYLLERLLEHPDFRIKTVILSGQPSDAFDSLVETVDRQGLPHFIRPNLQADDFQSTMNNRTHTLGLCTGYEQKIPSWLINRPDWGTINAHDSLLPDYRGPCPFFWVIRNREQQTGVTLHYMTEEIDAGPIIDQKTIRIEDDETVKSLLIRSTARKGDLIEETLNHSLEADEPPAGHPQDSGSDRPEAPEVTEDHLQIDWTETAAEVDALVRAAHPFYGARFALEDRTVIVDEVEIIEEDAEEHQFPGHPEEFVLSDNGPVVRCADGWVRLTKLYLMDEDRSLTGTAFQQEHHDLLEQQDRLGPVDPEQ